MIRVYGTSDPEIQDVIRRLKIAQVNKTPISWNLIIKKRETQFFTYDGKKIHVTAIYAQIGDELEKLGYLETEIIKHTEKEKSILKPIYRGGDVILKGYREQKKIFSYEPLKVTRHELLNDPYKIMSQINFIAASVLLEDVSVTMERKLFGLAFELEKKEQIRPVVLKNLRIKR